MSDLRYSVGAASIAADGTVVTLSGAILSSVNIRPWDAIQLDPANNNILIPIIAVDQPNLQLTVPEWNGGAKTNVPYIVYQISPERYVGGRSMADVDAMLAALNTEGWYRYINPAYADPTAAGLVANEGQFAFKYTTGQLWIMDGGVWKYVGVFKGLSAKGDWSASANYNANDIVSLNGVSYFAIQSNTNQQPPNATYWSVLAAKGDTGPAVFSPIAAWATGTAYTPGPPASYVSINGSSYACAVAHTSGTFATDLAAGKWVIVSSKGADAPLYGGTSTSALTVGAGTKAFVTQTNLAWQTGARVRATSTSNTSIWMEGPVNYTSGSSALTMSVDKFNGSGTVSDWNFNPVGQPGAGDLSSANNLSDLSDKQIALSNLGFIANTSVRLSLLSGTPVSVSDITSATNIYAIPVDGGFVACLKNGNWVSKKISQLTLSLDATSSHAGFHQSGKIFDIFYCRSASQIDLLATGPAWASDTSRGTGSGTTELTFVDGKPVNNNSIVLRFGTGASDVVTIAANEASYLGSFRAIADGQACDTAAKRLLFNFYRSSRRKLYMPQLANNWSYTANSFRYSNGDASQRVEYLAGFAGATINAFNNAVVVGSTTSTVPFEVGIGHNDTNVVSTQTGYINSSNVTAGSLQSNFDGDALFGWNFLTNLEKGNGSTAVTVFGTNNGTQSWKTGLSGSIEM